MQVFKYIQESLLHLAFPHVCAGCGNDILSAESQVCLSCINALPETNFHLHSSNPVEKIFWGRLPLQHATAQYYFTKESLMQHLMHQLKYKGDISLGLFLGRLMGTSLIQAERFKDVEALVPLPLFRNKEKKRGYNQAAVLCDGMAEIMKIPVLKNVVARIQHTDTQTKKSRIERWLNIESKFVLTDPAQIAGKHVLLVDDVITTGATLEACGQEILQADNTRLSMAALCYASR